MKWTEVKTLVEAQMSRDPQRATLAKRAISQVEEGLSHLMSCGHQFEIAPKGTLAELVEAREAEGARPLSIADAVSQVTAKLNGTPQPEFEAQES